MKPEIKIKRIYEEYSKADGYRILVDRLWPRGIKKDELKIDLWLKEIAPSAELRKWFSHDPAKWRVFKQKYFKELDQNKNTIKEIFIKSKGVTFLYGAKDEIYNNANALKEFIEINLKELYERNKK